MSCPKILNCLLVLLQQGYLFLLPARGSPDDILIKLSMELALTATSLQQLFLLSTMGILSHKPKYTMPANVLCPTGTNCFFISYSN